MAGLGHIYGDEYMMMTQVGRESADHIMCSRGEEKKSVIVTRTMSPDFPLGQLSAMGQWLRTLVLGEIIWKS